MRITGKEFNHNRTIDNIVGGLQEQHRNKLGIVQRRHHHQRPEGTRGGAC